MTVPNRPQREAENDALVVQNADKLSNESNLIVFGHLEAKLPTGVRQEIRERVKQVTGAKTAEPLAVQAMKRMKEGDYEGADAILSRCVTIPGVNLDDDRFFMVEWNRGVIAMKHRHDLGAAEQFFLGALRKYGSKARETHFLQALETMNELGRDRLLMMRVADDAVRTLAEKERRHFCMACAKLLPDFAKTVREKDQLLVSDVEEAYQPAAMRKRKLPTNQPSRFHQSLPIRRLIDRLDKSQ